MKYIFVLKSFNFGLESQIYLCGGVHFSILYVKFLDRAWIDRTIILLSNLCDELWIYRISQESKDQ